MPKEAPKARSGLGFTVQGGYILSADVPLECYGLFGMVRQVKKGIEQHGREQ